MNKTNSKWFTSKKFIIASLLIAFAVSIFSAIAFNVKAKRVDAVVASTETTELSSPKVLEDENTSISFAYNNSTSGIQSMSVSPLAEATAVETKNVTGGKIEKYAATIYGGTKITFPKPGAEGAQTITYENSGSSPAVAANTKLVVATPNKGYKVTGYKVGKQGSTLTEVTFTSNSKTMTTEEIITDYTAGGAANNKIEIQVIFSAISYTTQLYMDPENDGKFRNPNSVAYTVASATTITETKDGQETVKSGYQPAMTANETKKLFGSAFNSWVLVKTDTTFTFNDNGSDTVTITKGDTQVAVKYYKRVVNIDTRVKDSANKAYTDSDDYVYFIRSFQGYGIIEAAKDNDGNVINPILRAKWSLKYELTIDNSDNLWDTTYTSYGSKADVKVEGVKDSDGKTVATTTANTGKVYIHATACLRTISITSSKSRIGHEIVSTNTSNDGAGKFTLYNYGHELTGWKIMVQGKYLKFSGTAWSLSGTAGNVGFTQVTQAATFQKLASFLDDKYALVSSSLNLITMEPVWTASTIRLYDTVSQETQDIKYNASYAIRFNDTSVGQALYAFQTNNKAMIAIGDGRNTKWNYKDITEYADYNANSKTYQLSITPVFLDNIYKVKLKFNAADYYSITSVDDIKSKIVNNTYNKFYDETNNPDAADCYDNYYADDDKTWIQYNAKYNNNYYFTGYQSHADYITANSNVFVENYISSVLKTFKTNYATLKNNPKNSWLFFSGSDNSLCIHVANNSEIVLPAFAKTHYNLIAWKTTGANKKAYEVTGVYDGSIHSAEFTTSKGFASGMPITTWTLSTSGQEKTLEAHFFRKYFVLNTSTVLNINSAQQEAHVGYVKLTITDNLGDGSGSYLVYEKQDPTTTNKPYKKYIIAAEADGSFNIEKTEFVTEIKFYAGSILEVEALDQSTYGLQDKEIIGYRVSSYTVEAGLPLVDVLADITTPVTGVDGKLYSVYDAEHLSVVYITGIYDLIQYNITVRIDDASAGHLEFSQDTSVTTSKEVRITRRMDGIKVEYFAEYGYTFEDQAIVMGSLTLASWDETNRTLVSQSFEVDGRNFSSVTAGGQIFSLALTGEWLYNYYYSLKDTTFSTNNVQANKIDKINVKTEKLEFTYKVCYEDKEGKTIEISKANYKTEINKSIQNLVSNFLNCTTYYKDSRGVDYAVVGSYVTGSLQTKICEYSYAFPMVTRKAQNSTTLKEIKIPNKNEYVEDVFAFTKGNLSKILNNNTEGEILSDTEVIFVLDCREIITLKVEFDKYYNLMEGYSSTFKCSDSTLTIDADNRNGEFKIYRGATYSIATNTSGAKYIQNVEYHKYKHDEENGENEPTGCRLTGLSAITYGESDSYKEIHIKPLFKMIPDGDETAGYIIYKLNGQTTSLSNLLGGYLDEDAILLPQTSDYILNAELSWAYKLIKENHVMSFKINGAVLSSTAKDPYTHIYTATMIEDYYTNKLVIEVCIDEIPNNELIQPMFVLPSGQAFVDGEEPGEVKVLIAGAEATADSSGKYRIYEGQSLQLDISNLAAGYKYNRTLLNSSDLGLDPTDDIITITDSYAPASHKGVYTVEILRLDYVAKLDTSKTEALNEEGKTPYYMELNDGAASSESLQIQVGNKLTFGGSHESEKVLRFYYKNKSGVEVNITNDELQITSDFLTSLFNDVNEDNETRDIVFYVQVEKRHTLDIVIESGDSHIINGSAEVTFSDGTYYTLNSYQDKGTKVNVLIESIISGQYLISVTSSLGTTYSYNGYDSYDQEITLDQDVKLTVNVSPKQYSINSTSWEYKLLPDWKADKADNIGSKKEKDVAYDSTQTIRYQCVLSDKVITKIKVNGEVLEIDVDKITNSAANSQLSNGAIVKYGVEGSSKYIDITVKCTSNVQIELYYLSLVEISQD